MKHLKHFASIYEAMEEKELKKLLTYNKRLSKRKVKLLSIDDDTVEFVDIDGDLSGKKTTMKKSKFLKEFYR